MPLSLILVLHYSLYDCVLPCMTVYLFVCLFMKLFSCLFQAGMSSFTYGICLTRIKDIDRANCVITSLSLNIPSESLT